MFTFAGFKLFRFFKQWGEVAQLVIKIFKCIFTTKKYGKQTIVQMLHLGVNSLPVTMITALCVGMAFTIQVVRELLRFGATEIVGGVVAMAIWRELGPMLTGVVVAGRVGAAISAEIGTMKVTEQVEALEAMSQDPVKYLVLCRVLACTIMLPLLVGIADIVGFLGGFFVAVAGGHVNPYSYIGSANRMLGLIDIFGGLGKAVIFGFIISVLSCYVGLSTKGGAKGVGVSTTKAVVISLMAVFIINYFLSLALF